MQINFEKAYYELFKLMRFIRRHIIGIIVFFGIEIFTFVNLKPSDLESFFLIWTLIAFIFLGYNVFNITADDSSFAYTYTHTNQYGNYKMAELEKKYETKEGKKRNGGGIFDPINFIYLFMVVVNIIGYIRVMP